jgi:ABC-2 type transport system ATP-binding protein
MTPTISTTALGRRYRGQAALEDVSLEVEPDTVTGLLGRNGAGKTTLMRIVTGLEFPTSGSIAVFGETPAENESVLRRMVFVREDQAYPDLRVSHVIRVASWFYPNWSEELARQLLTDFDLPLQRRIRKLSRGMRSAVGIVIGLAARAELTLFDEPYAGLDAVARQVFYDRLLADFAEFPRTVLLSTHLIDEAAALFEGVIVIDRGRVVLDAPADVLRGVATRVSGPCLAVDALAGGRPVWERRRLGSQASVVMVGPLSPDDREQARSSGLDLTPLSLQQIVVQAAAGVLAPAPETSFETERTCA